MTASLIDSPTAWRMAGVAFTVGFVVFGIVYSFGVFLEPLMADLGSSRSATSALYAVSSSVFYFLGPATGSIGDRIGPRLVSAIGVAAMTIGLIATAFVDSIAVAYLTYGLGVGLGAACTYIPTFAVVGGWFDRSRTKALSIAAAGTGCGMLAFPPLAAVLIESVGWRKGMIVQAVIGGIALAISAALVRPAPAPPTPKKTQPLGTTLRSRAFIFIYVSWVLGTMALFVPLVFLPTFATSRGADPIAASWLISIIGAASVLGRVGIGYVPATIDTLLLYKSSILAMAASYLVWLLAPVYGWLLVFSTLLGLAYGIRIALVAPVLIELFGAGQLGALLGSFFTGTGVAGLAGPMLASVVVDSTGNATAGIAAAVVMGTLGFLFVLPLRAQK